MRKDDEINNDDHRKIEDSASEHKIESEPSRGGASSCVRHALFRRLFSFGFLRCHRSTYSVYDQSLECNAHSLCAAWLAVKWKRAIYRKPASRMMNLVYAGTKVVG
jgi:hypothetical protein